VLGVQRAEKVFCGGEDAVQLLRQVLWYCATAALCNCCVKSCGTCVSLPVLLACAGDNTRWGGGTWATCVWGATRAWGARQPAARCGNYRHSVVVLMAKPAFDPLLTSRPSLCPLTRWLARCRACLHRVLFEQRAHMASVALRPSKGPPLI